MQHNVWSFDTQRPTIVLFPIFLPLDIPLTPGMKTNWIKERIFLGTAYYIFPICSLCCFRHGAITGGSSINNISPILAKMSYIHQINQEIKLHLLRQKWFNLSSHLSPFSAGLVFKSCIYVFYGGQKGFYCSYVHIGRPWLFKNGNLSPLGNAFMGDQFFLCSIRSPIKHINTGLLT